MTDIVTIVGGCGHVGLPLAIALADAGLNVRALDIDAQKVKTVNAGILPFAEENAGEKLSRVVKDQKLIATTERSSVAQSSIVIIVVGTPVDEFLNPIPEDIVKAFEDLKQYFQKGQLVILRSTVFPGVTKRVENWFAENAPEVDIAFCPERIAEGKAMTELYSLPQIVGARSESGRTRAGNLFSQLTRKVIYTTPEEAELAKLFTNVWRYIKFAAVNQFFMMANDYNVDFENVRQAITEDYPRAFDMPSAGFAAGPCLFKDTMQLGAFSNNTFALGHAAMLINEGLPLYLVNRISESYDIENLTVGILGTAFKPDVDDPRASLSYKLRKLLAFKCKSVLITDPYVDDSRLTDLETVLNESDLLIMATPHSVYRNLKFSKPVVDIWNTAGAGVLI